MFTPDGHRTAGREGGASSLLKICNNNQQNLGPEWSMSEVGTPPYDNPDKPHGLVASNTHTQMVIKII